MVKSIRANLQLASVTDVKAIASLDATDVSSKPEQYVKANLLGYYVLVNTWLLLIKQWSEYGWTHVVAKMTRYGLFAVIREFDQAALQIVSGMEVESSLVRALDRDIRTHSPLTGVPQDEYHEFFHSHTATLLLLLRYGKRFSPLNADLLRSNSLEGFVSLQKELKFFQRSFDLGFIRPWIKGAITRMVNWDSLCDELEKVDLSDLVFTPGVSFDTNADLVSKLKSVAKARVEYFPMPFGIPMLMHKGCDDPTWWGKYNQYEVHKVRITAVPKNYKTARIIAPEDVVRQATARRYFQIMDRYTPSVVPLHDQTVNQLLAREGSKNGESFATIDLSSASDRITWVLLYEVLPERVIPLLQRVLPTHYVYKDTIRQLQSAATMGNSVTFWLESILFAGIAQGALDFINQYGGEYRAEYDTDLSVYGDDIIVPAGAAPTVIEFLEKCGFVVNTAKSYFNTDGNFYYRESCGEEYIDGLSVSSIYFPRFPIEGTFGSISQRYYRDGFRGTVVTSMDSLIDLQHKLWGVCYPAALLVSDLVREADPKVTTSLAWEGFSDLYDYESLPVELPAPAGQWVDGKLKKIVVDGQIRYGHSGSVWVPNRNVTLSEEEMLLVDLYNYLHFLKFGPRYESPLDELLGVTSPPISYAEASLDGSIKRILIK